MARHRRGSNREPYDRNDPGTTASTVEPIDPTRRLGLWHRMRIRWRHRAECNPDVWKVRVRFDELMSANGMQPTAKVEELEQR